MRVDLREGQAHRRTDSLLFRSLTGRTLPDATRGKLLGDLGIDIPADLFAKRRDLMRQWRSSRRGELILAIGGATLGPFHTSERVDHGLS